MLNRVDSNESSFYFPNIKIEESKQVLGNGHDIGGHGVYPGQNNPISEIDS